MLGARLKGAANVIGVDLAQSELTNAASVAACDHTDNLCLPARDVVADSANTIIVVYAERGPGSAPPQPRIE
jgi:hypothetical protein